MLTSSTNLIEHITAELEREKEMEMIKSELKNIKEASVIFRDLEIYDGDVDDAIFPFVNKRCHLDDTSNNFHC